MHDWREPVANGFDDVVENTIDTCEIIVGVSILQVSRRDIECERWRVEWECAMIRDVSVQGEWSSKLNIVWDYPQYGKQAWGGWYAR